MSSGTLDQVAYRTLETRPRAAAESFRKSPITEKRKCQESVANAKKLRDRIRDLEASRAKWRDEAETAQSDLQRSQREVEVLELQLAQSAAEIATQESDAKKKLIEHTPVPRQQGKRKLPKRQAETNY